MPFFFTTLTLCDNLPIASLQDYLSLKPKWLFVHEYGKNQTNHHIHALFYVNDGDEQRTDKYTKQLQNLYGEEFLKTLPDKSKLVRTKCAPRWQTLYKAYLLKEAGNATFDSLTYGGFEKTMLNRLFKEARCEHLMDVKVKVSLTSAPQYIYNYMKTKGIPKDKFSVITIARMMMSDGYIMHHLIDDRILPKIEIGLDCLLHPMTYVPQKKEVFMDDEEINF